MSLTVMVLISLAVGVALGGWGLAAIVSKGDQRGRHRAQKEWSL